MWENNLTHELLELFKIHILPNHIRDGGYTGIKIAAPGPFPETGRDPDAAWQAASLPSGG